MPQQSFENQFFDVNRNMHQYSITKFTKYTKMFGKNQLSRYDKKLDSSGAPRQLIISNKSTVAQLLNKSITFDTSRVQLNKLNSEFHDQIMKYKLLIGEKIVKQPIKNHNEELQINEETIELLKQDLSILTKEFMDSPSIDRNNTLDDEIMSYKTQIDKVRKQINAYNESYSQNNPMLQIQNQPYKNTDNFIQTFKKQSNDSFMQQKLLLLQSQLKQIRIIDSQVNSKLKKKKSSYNILGQPACQKYYQLITQKQLLIESLQIDEMKYYTQISNYNQELTKIKNQCDIYDKSCQEMKHQLDYFQNNVQRMRSLNKKDKNYEVVSVRKQSQYNTKVNTNLQISEMKDKVEFNYQINNQEWNKTLSDVVTNSSLKNFSLLNKVCMNQDFHNSMNRPFGKPVIKGVSNKFYANEYLDQLYDKAHKIFELTNTHTKEFLESLYSQTFYEFEKAKTSTNKYLNSLYDEILLKNVEASLDIQENSLSEFQNHQI